MALDLTNNEVAVTVQHINKVEVYRREAKDDDKPLRIIQGQETGLSDPHGIFVDARNNELFVANHDSYHEVLTGESERNADAATIARGTFEPGAQPRATLNLRPSKGRFVDPAITIYARNAQGNAIPRRVIRGPKTELSLPMKIFVDTVHNELFVANSGTNSILVFSRTANGDAAPIRKIQGPGSGLRKPVGLFVDTKNDEVWATNPGNIRPRSIGARHKAMPRPCVLCAARPRALLRQVSVIREALPMTRCANRFWCRTEWPIRVSRYSPGWRMAT